MMNNNKDTNTPATGNELQADPVYGPDSPFFWPGSVHDARSFALDWGPSIDCESGEEFLEVYARSLSGVEDFLCHRTVDDFSEEDVEYRDRLYDDFYLTYDKVRSWDYKTLFVSAVYRCLLSEILPYQSKLCELRVKETYPLLQERFLSKGLTDEAICYAFGQSQEETERDKAAGSISDGTWSTLIGLLLEPYIDPSVLRELLKMLKRNNLADGHQEGIKRGYLEHIEFQFRFSRSWLSDLRNRHLACLSLLQIPTERGNEALEESLTEQSFRPLRDLITKGA